MSIQGGQPRTVTPYSKVTYRAEDYPDLAFYLPLDEGSGSSFNDHAGGLVWTPQASGLADIADLHSVANAVTVAPHGAGDASIGGAGSLSGPVPVPTGTYSLMLAVFGAMTETGNMDGDFMYLRMGQTSTGTSDFVYSMNTNNELLNNCLKNSPSGNTIPPSVWTAVATPCSHAIVTTYTAPSTIKTEYYVDTTISTGNTADVTAEPILSIPNTLTLTTVPKVPLTGLAPIVSLYNLQFWHFDTLPADLTTGLLWTRDAALSGNKTPYPGWRR